MGMDLITLEVLRHKFDVIADELESALLKRAYSSIVKEGMDASSALFTTGGETIAQKVLSTTGRQERGNDGRTAARPHTDGFGAVLHASYGHAG